MAFIAALASSAIAVSLPARSAQDVFTPAITSPKAGDIWNVGSSQTVTWDASNPPAQLTNNIGQIMLVKNGYTTPVVLAAGFPILDGSATFVVPNVINGTNYAVQLFGDSGDLSPAFTVIGSNSFF
ncbi:hypothetical protein HYPSUDRAFT_48030 [Hypholoma sublateritium FD-334 SS-4]|uniref:Yeast cell wall synthesis Kre9/Knh1-like N-terminal domain-containing protein n=1 Tax=Hypholoma sublateritium (strain FD-334 SS-4) TaxID=945553 RepID=A0A0D2P616_HYPSF|nr:hypothetical protein HYPSUDRAFT_48030 [Hypholoma sublateritium FD-334 SS-4]